MPHDFADLVRRHVELEDLTRSSPLPLQRETGGRVLSFLREVRNSGSWTRSPDEREWLESTARRWSQYLYQHTDEFHRPAIEPFKGLQKPPYKFLDSFDEGDSDIFMGRDRAVDQLTRRILASRISTLYGGVGTGKTSLVNAGLLPRLRRENCFGMSIRTGQDPIAAARAHVVQTLETISAHDDKPPRIDSLSLGELLGILEAKTGKVPVLVFDQFEELFSVGTPDCQRNFEECIASILSEPGGQSRFLISIREDFVPRLLEFSTLKLFDSYFQLPPLTLEEARQAIVEPAAKAGISYEPGLAESIVKSLAEDGAVHPPKLQIVCDRLLDELAPPSKLLTEAILNSIGGVLQILLDYLDRTLAMLDEEDRNAARSLLADMVRRKGSGYVRYSLARDRAVAHLDSAIGAEKTTALLEHLVRTRLVRVKGEGESVEYELTHEFLIERIKEWVDQRSLKAKEVYDQIRQYPTLWPEGYPEQLLTLGRLYRADLQLEPSHLEQLLVSSVRRRQFEEFGFWLRENQENGRAVEMLLPLLEDADSQVAALGGLAVAGLTSDDAPLKRVIHRLQTVGNPTTLQFIEELESGGICIFPADFVKEARAAVEYRFTKDMAQIKAGHFVMGTTEETIREITQQPNFPFKAIFFNGQYPEREVWSDGFLIDKYLVTNDEFQEFEPSHKNTFPPAHGRHPVTQVTWKNAKRYAEWVGKDLPTEVQWERAARGEDARQFPWGNEWKAELCNTRLSGIGGTTPVDAYPAGRSSYGCFDMAGNVWEWTADSFDAVGLQKVLKGGSWSRMGILPWCWHRYDYEANSGYSNVGFRCVRPL